jgi:transcriptional regulator GlxA family with amidase domain
VAESQALSNSTRQGCPTGKALKTSGFVHERNYRHVRRKQPVDQGRLGAAVAVPIPRDFGASAGLPPHPYLMQLRVERARELLEGTNLSITEIAFACGFASSQHLATVFRRALLTTPTEYRWERRS